MINTRREFLKSTISFAGGALLLVACGDDSTTPPADLGPADSEAPTDTGTPTEDAGPEDSGAPNEVTTTIGSNHGHVLIVPAEDVADGVEKTYDITGAAGHAHSVTLTSGDFSAIAESGMRTVQSTTGAGHSHSVTVMM